MMMTRMYSLPLGALLLLSSLGVNAQGPKPGLENHRVGATAARGGAPANDECAAAIPLTVGTTCTAVTGNSEGATESQPSSQECSTWTSPSAFDVWYSFVATSAYSQIDVLGNEDFDVVVEAFSGACGSLTPISCNDLTFPNPGTGVLDVSESMTIGTTVNDTYYVRVYYYSTPVPANFTFDICVTDGMAPPPNDTCEGADAQALSVGSSITFTGDNAGATLDAELGDVAVWHAFTTTECSDVALNFCVEGSEFEDFFIALLTDCSDFENVIIGEVEGCTVTYRQLPAGTYYAPVIASAALAPVGQYSIAVSSTECDTYCVGNSEGCDEYIATFVFGTINNSSECGPTYQNFIDQSTVVLQDSEVAISVTNNPDSYYEEDQCVVWIDWNQNGDLEDDGSTTLTSADAGATFTGTVSVPADAVVGSTRLRARLMYTGEPSPCGAASYGDVEDYTVIVEPSTGVAERIGGNWSVFPNPTNGDFTIKGMQVNGLSMVELRDMTGRIVYSTSHTFSAGELATFEMAGKLASGTYSLVVNTPAGRTVRPVVVR